MAISNLTGLESLFGLETPLGFNAYLVVDRISYAFYFKRETRIHFYADIYTNSNKTTLVASKAFYIHPDLEIRELKGKVSKLPTSNLEDGDLYLVKNNYLPHILENWLLAKRQTPLNDNSPTDGWSFWLILPREIFSSGEKYYQINDPATGILTEVAKPSGAHLVWKVFNKNMYPTGDIINQCYLYLKSLPEFADTVDC